jgi:hypothetical protein
VVRTVPFKLSSTCLLQTGRTVSDPLFSVIINNYNYEQYLDDAIESIRSQTFGNFELIVVDDGSADNSLARAMRHDDVCVIRTDRLNQARACLEAIRYSRGQYIYILDADDIAETDLLDAVASELAGKPSKIQFQLRPIDASGHDCGRPFPIYPWDYSSAVMRSDIEASGMYLTPQTSGNVFSREVFALIDDIAYEGAIDGVSLLLCPFLGDVRSISRPLARYRLHDANESRPLTAERYSKERERFIDRLNHLGRILAERSIPISLRRPPDQMLYVIDRLFLEGRCRRGRADWPTTWQYLSALPGERSLLNAMKVAIWILAVAYGPNRLSEYLIRSHDEAWSPFRNLLRAPWKRQLSSISRSISPSAS